MPRLTTLVLGFITAILCGSLFAASTQPTIQSFNKMPLAFTQNNGQWDSQVLFRANAGGATMWFTKEGVTYQFTRRIDSGNLADRKGMLHVPAGTRSVPLQGTPPLAVGFDPLDRPDHAEDSIEQLVLTAKFVGANPNPDVVAEGQMEYKCNYFLGNEPSKWHTDVPNYEAITLKDIYPGIDVKYSGDGNGQAAYEFIVAPGADVAQIKVSYEGAEETSIDSDGRLILQTKWGDMIAAIKTPTNGVLSGVACFSQPSENAIGFKAEGSSQQALGSSSVGLVYSTYLGGSGDEWGIGIAVDGSGDAYVTGQTNSSNFPAQYPYQTDQGYHDAFVTKLSSSGNGLIYSTYLGGTRFDSGYDIAVDNSSYAYVTGETYSSDFPTQNPYQPTNHGWVDVFVTKLSNAGNSLIYSTYIGGELTDEGYGIAVDGSSYAYVTGLTYSFNFPTLNPYQSTFQGGNYDAFVTKLSSAGNGLIYSTYLGGGSSDYGIGIAVDGSGNAYVAGYTASSNFPTLNPYQTDQANRDAFVTKLSNSGNTLIYSTYLGGGNEDYVLDIAVDGSGNAYVTGSTWSSNFPTLNPYQADQDTIDAFVTKLSSTGNNLIYSTYLGGGGNDYGRGIAVDGSGNAYVTGYTTSSNFPTQNPFQAAFQGGRDVFVTKLYADALNDISDEMTPVSLPEKPALDQNYPNPFNPNTEIGFDLPKSSFVSLEIYDVLGRMVTSLINEHLTAGSKRVRWNGRDNTGEEVASGVYFYRLRTGDHAEVKKMVLLK